MRWNFLAIEEAFAAAAIDPDRWNIAMEVVAAAVPCRGAGLVPVHTHYPSMPHSAAVAEVAHEYLNGGWQARDVRYRGLPALNRRGITSDLDFATPEELSKNDFYRDFLARVNCPWFAGLKVGAGDELRCLTIQRSTEQGPFSPEELREFEGLSRSLSASAAVARSLGSVKAQAAATSFDLSGTPIVLLNARGEISLMNRSAEQVLGKDIRVVSRRLVSASREATNEMNRSLARLLLDINPRALMPPVVFPRSDAKRRPLLIYLMRIPSITQDVFGGCRAMAVVADLERRQRPPEEDLCSIFGLTPMEARVARELAAGISVEQAAVALGIKASTARVHLRAVYAKTDTHRQGELITMLARLIEKRD